MKKIIYFFVLFIPAILFGQDIHFSQFYVASNQYNPAFTGFFDNDFKVQGNFKTQWGNFTNPYRTIYSNAEISLLKNQNPNTILGLGLDIYNDKAGDLDFTNNITNLNLSYLQRLDKLGQNTIGIGFQTGISNKQIDLSKATFGNQFNGFNGFDQNINFNETNLNNKQLDFNLGIGLLYFSVPNPKAQSYLGFSIFNLTSPNQSFFSTNKDELYKRYVFIFGGAYKIKETWQLLPALLYQRQGPHQELTLGSLVRYTYLNKNNRNIERYSLAFGAWYRYKDAIIPTIKAEYKNVSLTFNFDVNISKLTKVSKSYGSAEISLVYSGNIFKVHNQRKFPLQCPAFNY